MIDAPNSIVEARKALIEKMRTDPASFISRIEPAEQVCPSLLRRVIGI
jgi:hypothetical protein